MATGKTGAQACADPAGSVSEATKKEEANERKGTQTRKNAFVDASSPLLSTHRSGRYEPREFYPFLYDFLHCPAERPAPHTTTTTTAAARGPTGSEKYEELQLRNNISSNLVGLAVLFPNCLGNYRWAQLRGYFYRCHSAR